MFSRNIYTYNIIIAQRNRANPVMWKATLGFKEEIQERFRNNVWLYLLFLRERIETQRD